MADILIIDDDKIMSDMLVDIVNGMGHTAHTAFTLDDAAKAASRMPFSVILLDVNLPDGNGLEKLQTFRELPDAPEVIIITAYGDRSGAEVALNSGAWDYIYKTASIAKIRLSLLRAIQYAETRKERVSVLPEPDLEGIIGHHDYLSACISRLTQAAQSDGNILISGETGTGKELFAQAIHRNSRRAGRSFVTVDCAALPPTLAESLLFGHEKGAFTGADKPMDGMIMQADGGTLFLDEIGDLNASIQKTFLRVLQEHRFRPLGAKQEIKSDFRVVAATNRNLEEMARKGDFRLDLLHRIRALVIELPPLRKHPSAITELVLYYMTKLCRRYGISHKNASPEFLEALVGYGWPGNVRELINAMEWAIAAALQEQTLYPKHLPTQIRLYTADDENKQASQVKARDTMSTLKFVRESAVAAAESSYLKDLIHMTKGSISEACRISGLSRPQLYAQLRKHHLTRSSF